MKKASESYKPSAKWCECWFRNKKTFICGCGESPFKGKMRSDAAAACKKIKC